MPNTPALTNGQPPATLTSIGLSAEASRLLNASGESAAAAEDIARNHAVLAEVKAKLPQLIAARDAVMRPAGPEEIMEIIGSRFQTYPQPQRNDAEWAAFWGDYFEVLEDCSPTMLRHGMKTHLKSGAQFLPKPGELRELARTAPIPEVVFAYRARLAADLRPIPTAEEAAARRDEVRKMMADMPWKKTSEGGL